MASEPIVFMRDTIIVNNDLRTRLHRLCCGQVCLGDVLLKGEIRVS